ncbi:Quinol monooxygenase YgiN [Andreprevotia lacus DSM 23236]|uniref:Quinol monooxygenase YgiN n=1 Tax=Andreprevotia lacus DSM 23236 TaxID=1121001 RepID=A0A1W1XNL2_9NEIS|nr:antibiotic biosynthesis monooxygenase [Andreprevotia lacus]SMC25435.1 Quinol monooxygenase YgiN [Andreprevotia lacus DSM 23236]
MATNPIILINRLQVEPANQAALLALLQQNIDTVIRTLAGWRRTRLIAAPDGSAVIIYSEWDSPAAVETMRADPRMQAYFPQILALARFDAMSGELAFSAERENALA